MTRTEYYENLQSLAREQRKFFQISSLIVTLSDLRKVYKHYGISITLWPPKDKPELKTKRLRGAYMNIDGHPVAMVTRKIPPEQRIFTLAHELKHHLIDSEIAKSGSPCDINSENDYIEKGAEVFAAEFIFPQADFVNYMITNGIEKGQCSAETIVKLKKVTGTTLSYTSLAKRATFLKYAILGSLDKIAWKKLEESMYGQPLYKRIQQYRQRVAILR
jgi:Zn-dependent peptidase ImmA (M78 family)